MNPATPFLSELIVSTPTERRGPPHCHSASGRGGGGGGGGRVVSVFKQHLNCSSGAQTFTCGVCPVWRSLHDEVLVLNNLLCVRQYRPLVEVIRDRTGCVFRQTAV
ncbi:hypothetical protein CRENBAI_021206 [Crenichthys baileyi]|uniref:Uncharacterized protein n=1 Tax=Crenichthys baileyi TaxID=28760 RepID=A0AAV9REW8_9TELE